MSSKCDHSTGASRWSSGVTIRFLALPLGLLAALGCSSGDGANGNQAGPATCGNNQLDPGEQCDGPNFSAQLTCAAATQGTRPVGNVTCNAACAFDTSTCTAGGTAGAGFGGGTTGAGGFVGAGGFLGAGGIPIGAAGFGGAPSGAGGTGVAGEGAGGLISMAGSPGNGGSPPGTGGAPQMTPGEPVIPAVSGSCPQIVTGNITVMGQQVQIWAGAKSAKPAPILFYWHGTGGSSSEASAFMGAQIQEIQSEGGVVASFSTSLGTGTNTGDLVWYTDDFKMADQILACAVQQLNIDTHQIYSAGCSAGGLQTGAMAVVRSSYIAGGMPNSGGSLLSNFETPNYTPALITAHGSYSGDYVILHFSDISKNTDTAFCKRGAFAVDCDHGGGHCGAPAALIAAQWQFLKDHPYGTTVDPYNGTLPSSFPSYCTRYAPPGCP